MSTRAHIRFLRRGHEVVLDDVAPTDTVLDYLRQTKRETGTKEGCAEGDCGACTVAVGEAEGGKIVYRPVNSCIQLLASLDGKELVTVDDLRAGDGKLHPVQSAMVEHHASQCGFCTPGFVMSLFVLAENEEPFGRGEIVDALAGNLCRCTGYRPIIDAALEVADMPDRSLWPTTLAQLQDLDDGTDVFVGNDEKFIASPASEETLKELYSEHNDAVLVGGATDAGLWITKQLREIPKIILLGRVKGLTGIKEHDDRLEIGAATTYRETHPFLAKVAPDLGELVRRIGSAQVRSAGTVGGNIANGSPIGDMPPALIALDARIVLQSQNGAREPALEDFFIDYGKQDIKEGEYLSRIIVAYLPSNRHFRCYKISKRFDQDISSVMGAFSFTVEGGAVADARIAYGGMAAIPKRARETEAAVTGLALDDEAGWVEAAEKLGEDFSPITDMRASAAYRLETAKALLKKARTEIHAGRSMRVTGNRPGEKAA